MIHRVYLLLLIPFCSCRGGCPVHTAYRGHKNTGIHRVSSRGQSRDNARSREVTSAGRRGVRPTCDRRRRRPYRRSGRRSCAIWPTSAWCSWSRWAGRWRRRQPTATRRWWESAPPSTWRAAWNRKSGSASPCWTLLRPARTRCCRLRTTDSRSQRTDAPVASSSTTATTAVIRVFSAKNCAHPWRLWWCAGHVTRRYNVISNQPSVTTDNDNVSTH